MGIVYDPELYRATEKDFAPYEFAECARSPFQTWHTDMQLDNGYYATIMFAFTGPLRTVLLQIVDDKGEIAVESIQFFDEEDCEYIKDGYEIHIGENFFIGNFPNIVIHANDPENNAGVDLVVEFESMPIKSELPNGVGTGRINTPNMPVAIAWYFAPWAKITGTMTVAGKTMDVSGYGWTDHQFGTDDFFTRACQYYYWACFPLGDEIIVLFEAQGGAAQGYRNMKWLWNFKDGKVFSYERNADYYIYATDIEEGDTVPKRLMYVFEGDRIRGKVTADFKVLMQKQPVESPPLKAMLNRAVYDCHAEMEIDGKKIDTTFERILEAAWTLDPPPGFVTQAEPPIIQQAVPQQAAEEPEPPAETGDVGSGRLSIKSKLREVLADPEGNAVLEKHLPGISNDPNTKLGYGMKLSMLFKMPQTGVSKEQLAQIDRELRSIK